MRYSCNKWLFDCIHSDSGDKGDNFYIVASGHFDCFVTGKDGVTNKVFEYNEHGPVPQP